MANSILGALNNTDHFWVQASRVDDAQLYAQAAQAAQAAQHAQSIGKYQTTTQAPALGNRARELFLKRMGGVREEMKVRLGDFVACHVHTDQVYLFYCFAGKAGVTQEQIDIFPSDTLITQFRMILA